MSIKCFFTSCVQKIILFGLQNSFRTIKRIECFLEETFDSPRVTEKSQEQSRDEKDSWRNIHVKNHQARLDHKANWANDSLWKDI